MKTRSQKSPASRTEAKLTPPVQNVGFEISTKPSVDPMADMSDKESSDSDIEAGSFSISTTPNIDNLPEEATDEEAADSSSESDSENLMSKDTFTEQNAGQVTQQNQLKKVRKAPVYSEAVER